MKVTEATGERIHAPELDGARAWLNVDRPLSLKELRGQVVVLDFWTYCCVNCMHVQPTLRAVEEKFSGEPLVVIGVHSAKFDNEQDPRRIREAVARYEIAHPIAVDDEMRLWSRFAVRSWPTLIVVRPDGTIAAVAPGEPDPRALERLIARELEHARQSGTLAREPFVPSRPREAEAGPLRFPGKISVAPDGRIAIADSGHHRVLVCAPDGAVLAAAGSGRRGWVDGAYTEAAFDDPEGVAWRGDGRVVVCDVRNHALREIDLEAARVSTVAGTGQLGGARLGWGPRPARETALRSPWDLAVEGDTVYIALAGSHQIGVWDAARGTIAAFAGSGAEALLDGPLAEAAFAQPSGLWLDRARRRLYVADSETSSVRAVDLARGTVETLVGEGLFDFGDVDGPRERARLQHDLGVCGRGGEIFIADTYNGKIKVIDEARGELRTAWSGELLEPAGLCFAPDGRLLVADTNHHRVLALSADLKRAAPLEIHGAPPIAGSHAAPQKNSAASSAASQNSSAQNAAGADWFTAILRLPDGAALAPGAGAIELTLLAPPDQEFAADSPLRVLIEISRRPDLLSVDEEHRLSASGGARQPIALPARVAPLAAAVESELIATIDFVACKKGDAAACTPGRSLVRVPLRLAPSGGRALGFEVPLQLA